MMNKRKLQQLQRLINNYQRHRNVLAEFCREHYGRYPGEAFEGWGWLPSELDADKFDRIMSEGKGDA